MTRPANAARVILLIDSTNAKARDQMKKASTISFVILTLALMGCTPPMPPEVKAAIADKYVTCVDGPLSVSAHPDNAEILSLWVDSYSANCKNSQVQVLEFGAPVDVVIAGRFEPTAFCTADIKIPVGLDGVVATATVEGIENIVFSPELLNRVLLGQVATWQDPELVALNPEILFPDLPLQVAPSGSVSEVEALNAWMAQETGGTWQPITPSPERNIDELTTEGSVGITNLANATFNALSVIEMQLPESEESLYPEAAGVDSAATQMVLSESGAEYVATIDPTLEPIASEGTDDAATPWHGVSQTSLTICQGPNQLASKAFAKYVLRLDSQGEFVAAGHNQVSEQIRQQLLEIVSVGLPEPTIPPSDAPEEELVTEEPTEDPTDMPSEEPIEEVTDAATPEPTS
jgi:hypothetical protein